ncbi:MAG: helix-turn-helix transcriptional regulator [Bacteroidota bacterium]
MCKYSIDKTPADVIKDTAEKLRKIRKQAGYSQAELAGRSGVSLGSLKRFENTGQISLGSLLKLLHILDRLNEFAGILQAGDDMKDVKKLFTY